MSFANRFMKSRAIVSAVVGLSLTATCLIAAGVGSAAPAKSATQAALVSPPSAAAFKKYIGGVIQPGFNVNKLPSYERAALEVAAQPITPAEQRTLKNCLYHSPCQTGHGTLTIAYADSFGLNAVRKVYRAIIDLQLIRYPQVKTIIYTDGAGDVTKTISNFRSLVAQKVNGIIGLFDFGAAMLPSVKQAAAAGIPVVSESQNVPGATAQDILGDWDINSCQQGTLSGQIAAKSAPNATVAIYTGTPGNPFGAKWEPCAIAAVKAGGGTITTNGTTNWSPQGEATAAQALLASGVPNAIMYDYLQTAFDTDILAAGKTVPAAVGGSNDFAWYKLWLAHQGTPTAWKGYITQSQGGYYNVETSELIDHLTHSRTKYPLHGVLPTTVVSAAAMKPYYIPSLPSGTPFNSGLPASILSMAEAAPTL